MSTQTFKTYDEAYRKALDDTKDGRERYIGHSQGQYVVTPVRNHTFDIRVDPLPDATRNDPKNFREWQKRQWQ